LNLQAQAQQAPPPPRPTTPPPPPTPAFEDTDRNYDQGMRQYQAREYPLAIRSFMSVIERSPESSLVPNAYYWIGECYYALGDFTAARLSFQRVVDNHKSSNKYVDSLVKVAMTWLRQQQKDQARVILMQIKRDFPNYENMRLVDQQLRLAQ
jgi:tol-pal system protein YbgF